MATKKKRSTKKKGATYLVRERPKRRPELVVLLKRELGTLRELIEQAVENGNRLGSMADALQQAVAQIVPLVTKAYLPPPTTPRKQRSSPRPS